MSFWDTSALAKYYTPEADRAGYIALAKSLMPIHAARLAEYELQTTLRRKEAEGAIASGAAEKYLEEFRENIARGIITIHEDSDDVRATYAVVLDSCFDAVPVVFVRTADAIHIATALTTGETEFITADARQKQAAEVCGLTVLP